MLQLKMFADRFARTRLATRYLFTTFTVFSLLFACLLLFELWHADEEARSAVLAQHRLKTGRAAAQLSSYALSLRKLIADATSVPSSGADSILTDMRFELRRLLKLQSELISIRMLSKEGNELASVSRFEIDRLASRRAPSQVVPTQDFSVSPLTTSGEDPLVSMTIRSQSSTGPVHSLEATLNLVLLSAVLKDVSTDSDRAFVVDESGSLVSHVDASVLLTFPDRPQPEVPEIMKWAASRTGRVADAGSSMNEVFVGLGSNGRNVLAMSAQLTPLPWSLVVERDSEDAFAPVRRVYERLTIVALISLAAALFISWRLARQTAAPIERIRDAVELFGAGQLEKRIDVSGGLELIRLSRGFNSMAAKLENYAHDLEMEVAQKTSDLSRANRHKTDFLAHMSHELRTPLNAVIGFSELLKAQYFGPLNEKQAEYVRDIHDSGQHLLSLINDILDLAKIESGYMELVRTQSNVRNVVEACCALVSERVTRKSQSLTWYFDEAVVDWWLDERKLKQCLLNLLSNASKFTPEGGLIAVRVKVEGESLVVSVSDNGLGISSDDQSRLFTQFFQANAESGVVFKEGTGLGLALTKRFVELHGGSVSVSSELGAGSEFTLSFPRVEV